MSKGWFAMLFSTRTKEANAIGREITLAREGLERTNDALVKTLDEMLEATNAANRRDRVTSHHGRKAKDH